MARVLTDDLATVTDPSERSRRKVVAFESLTGQVGRSVTRGRFTVTLTSRPVLTRGLLTFSVRVDRDGLDVTPKDLNPIQVVNPPILVPDPAGDVVLTSTSVDGEVTTLRFREDLPAALLAIVRLVVLDRIR